MGLFSSIGGIINDLTGVSSSAKKGFQYSQALSNLNFEQQKYFAQNAHQLEMADLQKAGLNPALTATGGSGASASGGGGIPGNGGSPTANIFGIMSELAGVFNATKQTNANTQLQGAQAVKTLAETENLPQQLKNDTIRALADQMNAETGATNAKVNKWNAWNNEYNNMTNRLQYLLNEKRANAGKLGEWVGAENASKVTRGEYSIPRILFDLLGEQR